MTPSYEERYALTQIDGLTLNGKPCRISGAQEPYAQVVSSDGLRAEWSWPAAIRIASTHGRFQT